jgi:broad specificity phosphatase PhoE
MSTPQTRMIEVDLPELPTPIAIKHPTGGRTNFILVRHGRTDGNVRRVLVGRMDIPLDTLGERQAEAVGQYLSTHHKPDVVISSPLIRAHNTARAIAAKYNMEITFDPELMELNFGAFEGWSLDQIREQDPAFAASFGDVEHDRQWPEGERLSEFHARVMNAFNHLAEQYPAHTVVVVSHGGVMGSYAAQLLGTHPNDWARFQIHNCSVSHVELGPEGSIIHRLNDIDHLADVQDAGD